MCRVRNTHTSAPWTTAFICLTLDDSCTDEGGKYIDQPLTVRMVQWQPFCVKQPFDPKTPVCAACKKTNRTRSFCRERHKHRQLPWCTVYVLLSALETADPSTVVAGSSKPLDGAKKEGDDEDKLDDDEEKVPADTSSPTNDTTSVAESKTSDVSENKATGDGDNIHDISESRTFLAKVCSKSTTIHWLELVDFEGSDAGAMQAMAPPENSGYAMHPGTSAVPAQGGDPNQSQYYAPMGYAAQQHQNALKSHQQYFFQMQQRHQQHYAAQQAAWQSQYNQQSQMQAPPGTQPAPTAPAPHGGSSPAPVTAGEAAAQQQKRNREMVDGNGQAQQSGQGQPQGQQQQWMLYQQMYQSQLPPTQGPPYHPSGDGVNDQHYQTQMSPEGNGKANEDSDDDAKRQRLV
jgi:hypothetical protein